MDMKESLDLPLASFEELIDQTKNQILSRFEGLDTAKAFSGLTPEVIKEWLAEPLPRAGMDQSELLATVKEKVIDTATLNMGPNMYAYVMAGGTQISILAEMLAATINQNVGKWHLAPVITEMEKQVIQWGAEFIGFDPHAGGALVSGGSAANFTGLTVARNVFFNKLNIKNKGLFGQKPFIVYASTETHSCVDKSIDILGIGSDNYRKIPVMPDYTINMGLLKSQIEIDIADGYLPFCLIGNAGTVNTGAIDPLDQLAALAEAHGLWFHVDGAYGALAAGTDLVKEKYRGMDKADSLALDFHKWLYQPFEAGCTLVKNWSDLNETYFKKASYLATDTEGEDRFNFNEHQFQLSRNAKSLKIWMSFKAYGSVRIKQMIEKDILLTRYLAEQVNASTDFELVSEPDLGIVCFRFLGGLASDQESEIDQLNREIVPKLEEDGRVFITGTLLGSKSVIRACLINHRLQKENIDFLLSVIREVGREA